MNIHLKYLANKKIADILIDLSSLPLDIYTLNLSENKLGERPIDELTQIASALPPYIHKLNLMDNDLECNSGKKLLSFLRAITAKISHLNLCENALFKCPTEVVINILRAIPPSVSHISLRDNDLIEKNGEQLAMIMRSLPEHIRHLDLSMNELDHLKTEDIVLFLKSLPSHIVSLDLSENDLGYKSVDEIIQIVNAIPRTITKLKFNNNWLTWKTNDELKTIMLNMPAHLTCIDLGETHSIDPSLPEKIHVMVSHLPNKVRAVSLDCFGLGSMSHAGACRVIQAIPVSVHELSLKYNSLYHKCPTYFREFILSIPSHITKLNLTGNFICNIRGDEGVDVQTQLKHLPTHIKHLNLNANYLGHLPTDELKQILSALPGHLEQVDLCRNGFNLKDTTTLTRMIAAISLKIKRINLQFNDIFRNKSLAERDQFLSAIQPFNENGRIDLARNGESILLRTLLPMISLANQKGLPKDIVFLIISHFISRKKGAVDYIEHHIGYCKNLGVFKANPTHQSPHPECSDGSQQDKLSFIARNPFLLWEKMGTPAIKMADAINPSLRVIAK